MFRGGQRLKQIEAQVAHRPRQRGLEVTVESGNLTDDEVCEGVHYSPRLTIGNLRAPFIAVVMEEMGRSGPDRRPLASVERGESRVHPAQPAQGGGDRPADPGAAGPQLARGYRLLRSLPAPGGRSATTASECSAWLRSLTWRAGPPAGTWSGRWKERYYNSGRP